ncbi:hypothetical protein NQ318_019954 [Aromia moschata]|uniref:Mos1 transposase HTH domain-containing protein n=1 Tax=Aromia moschata TaxID=1265417 RepID=A0AAV8Y942_9CUCU|nr:hypothetical protein NQ318_019954 [Aromia moschata]
MLSVQMEQRINLKFLVKLGKTFTEPYAMLQVYGNECLFCTHVFEWFKLFKEGRETTEDDPRPGRPSMLKTDEKNYMWRTCLNFYDIFGATLEIFHVEEKCFQNDRVSQMNEYSEDFPLILVQEL